MSAVERGDLTHTELGTVATYVRALGGRIEIAADFGDRRLVIGLRGSRLRRHAGDRVEVLAGAEQRRLRFEEPEH